MTVDESVQDSMLKWLASQEVERRLTHRTKWILDFFGTASIGLGLQQFDGSDSWWTEEQNYVMTSMMLAILAMRFFATHLHWSLLPIGYSFLALSGFLFVFFSDVSNVYALPHAMEGMAVARAVFSVTLCDRRLAVFWNSLAAILNTYMFTLLEAPTSQIGTVMNAVEWEISVALCIICVSWHSRNTLERECSHLVKNRSLSSESSTLATLLGLVCDVVVELDASLSVTENVPRLSAMLCISRNTQGMDLMQYMPRESDRDVFMRTLKANASSDACQTRPGAMHSTLRDSMNNNISCEFFFVPFESSGDSARSWLVGIREVEHQPVAALPDLPSRTHLNKGASAHRSVGLCQRASDPSPRKSPQGDAAAGTSLSLSDHLGDPSAVFSEMRVEDAASNTSAISPQSSFSKHDLRQCELLDGRFSETSPSAKNVSIMSTLSHWNIMIPPESCCSSHALLSDLVETANALHRSLPRCTSSELVGDSQCNECGWVVDSKHHDGKHDCPDASMTGRPSSLHRVQEMYPAALLGDASGNGAAHVAISLVPLAGTLPGGLADAKAGQSSDIKHDNTLTSHDPTSIGMRESGGNSIGSRTASGSNNDTNASACDGPRSTPHMLVKGFESL